jgi:hypothetical protein
VPLSPLGLPPPQRRSTSTAVQLTSHLRKRGGARPPAATLPSSPPEVRAGPAGNSAGTRGSLSQPFLRQRAIRNSRAREESRAITRGPLHTSYVCASRQLLVLDVPPRQKRCLPEPRRAESRDLPASFMGPVGAACGHNLIHSQSKYLSFSRDARVRPIRTGPISDADSVIYAEVGRGEGACQFFRRVGERFARSADPVYRPNAPSASPRRPAADARRCWSGD